MRKKQTTRRILSCGAAFMILFGMAAPAAPFFATAPIACAATVKDSAFDVGQGIEWPAQVNAPYADMCEWVTKTGYNNNGAISLGAIAKDTGVLHFNLGFIQTAGSISGGKINWGWGGYQVLSENGGKNDDQYKGIKKSITDLRKMGGDVCISFGGASGTPFWQTTQDVDILYNTYLDIVDGYGLTRLDLDVEGGAQNKANNVANAKAIKKLQDKTGVDVVLTLPVLPDGLTYEGLGVLEAYLSEGVNLKTVNIMTMCYGSGVLRPGENYGTASLRAVDSLKDQLKSYYSKYANETLSDAQAYAKIGTTVSIGYESASDPIFTTDWCQLVVNQAISEKIGMTSFWSMNRDAMTQPNQGVNKQYEFTDVFKKFGDGSSVIVPPVVDEKPTISGVSDKEITVGDSFSIMEGVTAYDKEDGDLTSKIQTSGSVDTAKAGTYTITYSVTDSKSQTTQMSRKITVKEKGGSITPSAEPYDDSKVYVNGDIVVYEGKTYRCKWWTLGETPGSSQWGAWELIEG